MVSPVLRAVDNDEPMDFLTEVRRVVVVFLNIVTKSVTEDVLIDIVDSAYKCVCRLSSTLGGLVNKVSMFDKDMMFLVVFGLRGLKQEDEARKALQCAYELMENLISMDVNIISVSIGVTSGTTYCGVVGHVLRREYTVIGPTVNKAARLMMAYPMRVTCDKETFLRSKLEQEHFRIVEQKLLKGISKPGPIYEFNKYRWSERKGTSIHPILGRNDELRKYKILINNAIGEHKRKFTRYRDLKFAFAIIGVELVGKSRFLEECIHITPHEYRVETFVLTETDKMFKYKQKNYKKTLTLQQRLLTLRSALLPKKYKKKFETAIKRPFALFRMIMAKAFTTSDVRSSLVNFEDILRFSVNVTSLSALQLFALNTIFDCRFPLPEKFENGGNFLYDVSVKLMLQEIFKSMFPNLWVAAVKRAHYVDDFTWRMLIIMLETKTIFLIMTIDEEHQLSETACKSLENNMIVKILLKGIDRWYHGALACQLLDVQAIPSDLQKIIESASGGMPGWIQNFVISLVQRGVLTVVTVLRSEAKESGAVMPSPALLQRAAYDSISEKHNLIGASCHIYEKPADYPALALTEPPQKGLRALTDLQLQIVDSFYFVVIVRSLTLD
ncbi:unnamed protein product [Chilo suppressalis]|uniref:Guanylate cyclase domain-containing protein n=1 Tax=Chilo suppressalis TaxID=168631 RepID=A0ABN8B5K1_CHISP|nr:hypothetical protein evm_010441 [Chilo suppressalis]CAH0401382.1 unnamed protein product [Chilo suppressalis]